MCSGDVKNPVNLSIALNHLPGNNIMSSFSNVATFQHNKISEYPFNDSLRWNIRFTSIVFILSIVSEVSYGSHTNTHRLTDTSSHRGSRHMLTPVYPGHNGHINGFSDMNTACDDTEEKVGGGGDMLDLNQVQAELMLDVNAQEMMLNEYPADCCPVKFYLNFPCLAGDDDSPFWQGWANLRIKTFRLIENKYFETAVIAMILISSLALVRINNNHLWTDLINCVTRLQKISTYQRDLCYKMSCTTWIEYLLWYLQWRWLSSGSRWVSSNTSQTPGAGWILL